MVQMQKKLLQAGGWKQGWKLLEQELLNNRAIAFNHTRREGNKVADLLANIGVGSELNLQASTLDIIKNHAQAQECIHLVQNDANLLDAGAS